jgi:hypothetical protein
MRICTVTFKRAKKGSEVKSVRGKKEKKKRKTKEKRIKKIKQANGRESGRVAASREEAKMRRANLAI